MEAKDAYMFPIVGSCVLFGLYCLIKFFGKEIVNKFLLAYFVFACAIPLKSLLKIVGKGNPSVEDMDKENLFELGPFDLKVTKIDKLEFTSLDIISLILSGVLGVVYVLTDHWTANNALGILFCVFAIQSIFLGNFKVGAILLCGLFLYDIFWVFGTDVMVTVAKNIDGPIKLMFPKNIHVDPKDCSILGLGDIVIPGIFMALCLRFDILKQLDAKIFADPLKRKEEAVSERIKPFG